MVGVAGKSKGCNTCRRRKKGCDQQRPSCGRCIKSGIPCGGYERQRVFIHASHRSPTSKESSPGSLALARVTVTPPDPAPAKTPPAPPTKDPAQAEPNALSNSTLCHNLTRTAFEIKYVSLFWESFLPAEHPPPFFIDYSNGTSVLAIRDLWGSDPALRKALLSLGLSHVARKEGLPWMADEALESYVGALQEMNAGLRDPKRRKSDALLATSGTLALYELLYGCDSRNSRQLSQARSWQGHNMGEAALVLERSPELHMDGNAHRMFTDGRMTQVIVCVTSHKRCYLSEHSWKTIPWTKIPKTPKDRLLDILVDTPGVLQDLDLLKMLPASSPQRRALRERLLAECWRLDGELTFWRDNLAPLEHLEALEGRRRRGENPNYDGIATAHSMALLWTACILVYSTLEKLVASGSQAGSAPTHAFPPSSSSSSSATYPPSDVQSPPSPPASSRHAEHYDTSSPAYDASSAATTAETTASAASALPARADPRQYCAAIADIADVFFHPGSSGFTWHSAPFPISIAIGYLVVAGEQNGPEMAKMMGLFRRARGGPSMGKFLKSVLREELTSAPLMDARGWARLGSRIEAEEYGYEYRDEDLAALRRYWETVDGGERPAEAK